MNFSSLKAASCFVDCIEACPQYVVLDNLKEGLLKPDLYEPDLNPVYAATLAHYGVVLDPARVRDPKL